MRACTMDHPYQTLKERHIEVWRDTLESLPFHPIIEKVNFVPRRTAKYQVKKEEILET